MQRRRPRVVIGRGQTEFPRRCSGNHATCHFTTQDTTNMATTRGEGQNYERHCGLWRCGRTSQDYCQAKSKTTKLQLVVVPGTRVTVDDSLVHDHAHLINEDWATAHTNGKQLDAQSMMLMTRWSPRACHHKRRGAAKLSSASDDACCAASASTMACHITEDSVQSVQVDEQHATRDRESSWSASP